MLLYKCVACARRYYNELMAKSPPRNVRTRPLEPTVTFWGAARSVTGSMHYVQACGQTLLLDCGLVQGGSRSQVSARNRTFPFRPRDINFVLLSHAHIDHCGNLPNLVRQGFTGTIYCTRATRALTSVMLGDAAKIQHEDAVYLNRHRQPGEPPIEPLFSERDVYRTLLRMKGADYDAPIKIANGLQATFVDAGHLLGSSMIQLTMETSTGLRRLTFTGDLGRHEIPILRPPSPVPGCDVLICESTYGGQQHEPAEETAERLGEVIRNTAARGGKVIIPAFSVGRTQTIVYFLHELIRAKRIRPIDVFVDSPMAVRATEVFRAHPECFDTQTLELLEEQPELFGEGWVQYVDKVHESIALNRHPGPCVIVSASGMCEAGRVLHHLRHNVSDPRSTILLVGFQAEGTLGRRLTERPQEVRIFGRNWPLRAEVVTLYGLSSHADHADLLDALRPLAATVNRVRLVHGELERAELLGHALRQEGFADVAIPERGQQVAVEVRCASQS